MLLLARTKKLGTLYCFRFLAAGGSSLESVLDNSKSQDSLADIDPASYSFYLLKNWINQIRNTWPI